MERINSKSYWDARFAADWDEKEGPGQSRFFSRVAIDRLPRWLFRAIREQQLTVVDWGCAEGDGTDELAALIDARQLSGVDFSHTAIERASHRYPAIRFLQANWLDDCPGTDAASSWDIVFSSNTLEHFYQPFDVLKVLCTRARKALVLVLPYRERERIEEHHFSFLPDNLPAVLSNGFRLIAARVADCRTMAQTRWMGEQVVLIYALPSWLDGMGLMLSDCEIAADDATATVQVLERALAKQNEELEAALQAVSQRDQMQLESERAHEAEIRQFAEREHDLREQLSSREQEARDYHDKVLALWDTYSWRLTRPLRAVGRLARAVVNPAQRYSVLKAVYWRLPAFLRRGLTGQRARYVAANWSAKELATAGMATPMTTSIRWLTVAQAAAKVAVIPCGFEFDELVNQRPINAAKYFAKKGYLVLFVAWQWQRDESLTKGRSEVWPGVWQVPLYEFSDLSGQLPIKRQEALYLQTMPAAVLANCVPALRSKGYTIVYDVMDDWEEFFRNAQAPWYSKAVEEQLVLQSDFVCGVSLPLAEKFADIRGDIAVIGNGYTAEVLGAGHRAIARRDPDAPIVAGYFGHLTDAWFDWKLVFSLAARYRKVSFEIVGYGEPQWVRDQARGVANVRLVGKVPPHELNTYVRNWSVSIIPFVEGKLSMAVDPIKIYEYIFFGLPVFVTGIAHLQDYPGVMWSTREAAGDAFETLLKRDGPNVQEVDDFLAKTTWDARFDDLCERLRKRTSLGEMYVL